MESVILAAVIDTLEKRDVAIVDIPNAFIQTDNPKEVGYQIDIMKIRGKLAHIIVDIAPEVYVGFTAYENRKSVLYL